MDVDASRDADIQETDKSNDRSYSGETQKFIYEFIDIYRQLPCLWKYSCQDYRNRTVKERAYNSLVDKMREIDPRADKNSVLKKINALRTAFRREYKKVKRRIVDDKRGKDSKKPYVPSLWYYDHLKFVVEKQNYMDPPPGASITDWDDRLDAYELVSGDGKFEDNNGDMEFLEDPGQRHANNEMKIEPISPCSSRAGSPTVLIATSTSGPTFNLEIESVYSKEQATIAGASNDESSYAWKKRRPQFDVDQTDFDRFGAYVASKLRRSSRKQSIIAEKVIAEVLMRANLGTLEETTVLTDVKASPSNDQF